MLSVIEGEEKTFLIDLTRIIAIKFAKDMEVCVGVGLNPPREKMDVARVWIEGIPFFDFTGKAARQVVDDWKAWGNGKRPGNAVGDPSRGLETDTAKVSTRKCDGCGREGLCLVETILNESAPALCHFCAYRKAMQMRSP